MGGLHARTADWRCVVVFVQPSAALLKGNLCKCFLPLAVETSPRQPSQGEVRKDPALTLLFCKCFPVVLHSLMECIPFNLPRNHLRFIICRWKKKGGGKMTNREGSFYLICVWSLAWVWNVCLGSSWRSLIIGHRDLSDCFLPSSFLSFPSPFFLLSFPFFVFRLKAGLPLHCPFTLFSLWWNLFVLLTLRFVLNRC